MAGFIYFLPNAETRMANHALMVKHGCGHASQGDNVGIASRNTTVGPGGAEGLLVAIEGDFPHTFELKHHPASQTWRKGPTRTVDGRELTFWVGIENDAKPTPDDLKRERVHPGNAVKLCDGNSWIIPRCWAVVPERPTTLPVRLDLADDGETIVARTDPAFIELSKRAFRYWNHWAETCDESERLSSKEMIDLAVEALAVNYRVGKVEVIALLSLWGVDEFGLILRAMIDADETEAFFARSVTAADAIAVSA